MAKTKKQKKSIKTEKKSVSPGKFSRWFTNIIVIFITVIALYLLVSSVPGFLTLKDNFVMANLKFIVGWPSLPVEEKWKIKFPNDFSYIHFVKTNTPDSAVIVMPPNSFQSQLSSSNGAQNKIWAEYFLYPRKLVYADENDNPLLEQANYIMIVNYWGYDYLKEKYGIVIPMTAPYTVAPIRKGEEN